MEELENYIEKISFLKKIRNCIVHNGGWCRPSEYDISGQHFKGVLKYVNTIIVKDYAVNNVLCFADNIIKIIRRLDTSKL